VRPTDTQKADAAKNGETWLFYPNDLPKRSAYSGDTRWALAPFLAHQACDLQCFSYPSWLQSKSMKELCGRMAA
jgi:hypothetical protein